MTRLLLHRVDPFLLAAALGLLAYGVLMTVSAATLDTGEPTLRAGPGLRQAVLAMGGILVIFTASRIDYHVLQRWSLPIYLAGIVLLVAVLAFGNSEYGARRWFMVAGTSFQPSELEKIALVVATAAILSSHLPRARQLMASLGAVGLAAVLVLVEPDTGTTVVMLTTWLIVCVASGMPWRVIGGLVAVGAGVLPLLFAVAVPAYQRERLAVFFDPGRDPLGSGFNLKQAELAIGSGGLTGNGLFGGADSALTHVAARGSDFIFAQAGEELGLLGALALLALFAVVVWRGFEAARHAPDAFGRLLAIGLTWMILTQAAVHIAVNVRLFPATGIPLPFISSGGSSLLAACIATGLLQSIAAQRPARPHEQWRSERWR